MIHSEKVSHSKKNFIPASFTNDHKQSSAAIQQSLPSWKTGAALTFGLWALRKFPKTTLLGGLLLGAYVLLNERERNPVKGQGLVEDIETYIH